MNITWKIEWLKTTPDQSTPPRWVLECGWRCSGVDGKHSATVYGTCSFAQSENEDGTFTPFSNLTEAQVLGWCWDASVNREACEESIAKQIETSKNPPVIQPPLPWARA